MTKWIIGCSGNYSVHDLSFTLVDADSGEVVYVGEQERWSRIRHSIGALPHAGILARALSRHGIEVDDIELIAVGCDPELFRLEYNREAFRLTEQRVLETVGLGSVPRAHFPHHQAHAASSFYPSNFDDAVILTVDGQGEETTCAIFRGDPGRAVVPLWEKSGDSIGNLYTRVTQWLGLGYMGDEGKTMGLAPYGSPRYVELFRERILHWDTADGEFSINKDILQGYDIESVLGARRRSDDELTEYHKDVAATIQLITEEILLGLANRARTLSGQASAICLAGGVALNSVGNGKLERSGLFTDYHFAPWAGDSGLSIGAGLLGYHQAKPQRQGHRWTVGDAYLGDAVSEVEVVTALEAAGLPIVRIDGPEREAADDVAGGLVIGWCQGRAEVGPRALGNRSILANPAVPDIARKVNEKVKFREVWRPFAPSVLVEDAKKYFDDVRLSPYMITVNSFNAASRDLFPSVTHVDYSGRIQTVTEEQNPLYRRFLLELRKLTGHGVALNTSLNIKGEPIVDSAEDMITAFLSTGLDAIYIGNHVLRKSMPGLPTVERFNSQRRQLIEAVAEVEHDSATVILLESELERNLKGYGRDAISVALRNIGSVCQDVQIATDAPSVPDALAGDLKVVNLTEMVAGEVPVGDILFVYAEAALFGVEGQAVLRRLVAATGKPGIVVVGDRTAHQSGTVREYSELWRRAYFQYPPPEGHGGDEASALMHQAG